MRAKIITIGSELVKGEVVDTNSSFISKELISLGINLVLHETCPDDMNLIASVLNNSSTDVDIVIVSGGLGPTDDDVTRAAFGKAFGVELRRDEGAVKDINEFFKKWGRTPSEKNLDQAKVPVGSRVIKNKWGTAPGFIMEMNGKLYYSLPGVPYELNNMFKEYVSKDLESRFGTLPRKKTVVFKMFGIPESKLNELCNELEKPEGINLGFYPRFPEVHFSISFLESDKKITEEADKYIAKIRDKFREFIFAQDGKNIEEKLVDALIKNKLTLSVAESCTGGLIASTIVNVAGSSRCFDRGVVAYSNESKVEVLSVARETLKKYGAVSKECAMEMAKGIRKLGKTDIGVSTTGIAGPSGGSKEKPVGTTYVGISSKGFEVAEHFLFQRERNMNRILTIYEAFTKLLKLINSGKI